MLHVFKKSVTNIVRSAVNRPAVSLSTSSINIHSSYQNTFTVAIHSPPPQLPSVLLYSVSLTAYLYVKKT